jgi:hypothetical protein
MKIIHEQCTTQTGVSLEQCKTQTPMSHMKLPVSLDAGAACGLVIRLSGIVS